MDQYFERNSKLLKNYSDENDLFGFPKDNKANLNDTDCEFSEIDELNDETFGGDIGDYEFDFEEQTKVFEKMQPDYNNDQAEEMGIELERRISDIVLDEIDDPAIMNMSKSTPIEKRNIVSDILADTPPDPSILNSKELQDIWRRPELQSSEGNNNLNFFQLIQNKIDKKPSLSKNLPNAYTLEELESKISTEISQEHLRTETDSKQIIPNNLNLIQSGPPGFRGPNFHSFLGNQLHRPPPSSNIIPIHTGSYNAMPHLRHIQSFTGQNGQRSLTQLPPRLPFNGMFPPPFRTPLDLSLNRPLQHGIPYLPSSMIHNSEIKRPPELFPVRIMQNKQEEDEENDETLMTQKEKDWIIKVQLLQLHTDNPYADDYYYTHWRIKKKDAPQLIVPNLNRGDDKYAPRQFDKALGRLTSSSIHNPRQVLDLSGISNKDNKSTNLRRFKQMLLVIENCYMAMLDVMELEMQSLCVPSDAREQLNNAREITLKAILKTIGIFNNKFDLTKMILSIRKGRSLISRLIPLLQASDRIMFISVILSCIVGYCDDKILITSLRKYILNENSTQVLEKYAACIGHNNFKTVLKLKHLNDILWCILSRMEELLTDDNICSDNWEKQMKLLSYTVSNINESEIDKSITENVLRHFKRYNLHKIKR